MAVIYFQSTTEKQTMTYLKVELDEFPVCYPALQLLAENHLNYIANF